MRTSFINSFVRSSAARDAAPLTERPVLPAVVQGEAGVTPRNLDQAAASWVGAYARPVARLWWSDVGSFDRELRSADDDRLTEMHRWARLREEESDRPGMGRNPKARRMFRQMRQAAEERLEERGLLWQ